MYSRKALLSVALTQGLLDILDTAEEVAEATKNMPDLAFETYSLVADIADELDARRYFCEGVDLGQSWSHPAIWGMS